MNEAESQFSIDQEFYRYEHACYGLLDYDDSDFCRGYRVELVERRLYVSKVTRKGVWLRSWLGDARFVLTGARKRYACPTKKEALESYIARQRRRIEILNDQLHRSSQGVKKAERELANLIKTEPVKNQQYTEALDD